MELRIALFLIKVLDPRLWRRRLLQLGAATTVGAWVLVRAVGSVEEVRSVRSERRALRRARIRADIAERMRANQQ